MNFIYFSLFPLRIGGIGRGLLNNRGNGSNHQGVHYLSKAVTEIVTTTKPKPEKTWLGGVETDDGPGGH